MRIVFQLAFLLAVSAGPAFALWFPLRVEPFDPNHGLTDFNAAWKNGHHPGYSHGCGATPIAPHWIVTAGHLRGQKQFDYKQWAHRRGGYQIVETVAHPAFPRVDLRLYRVKQTLVDYATLAKKRPGTNEVLTVYGFGKSAPSSPMKFNGKIIGWKLAGWTNGVDGLRVGEIARHAYVASKEAHYLEWNFADGPITAYGDSGYPVYHGAELLGVLFSAPSHIYFRFGDSGPCTNSAYIFDDAEISTCSNPPTPTQSRAAAMDLTQYLDWIYDTISPPLRLSASASADLPGWQRWESEDYQAVRTVSRIDLAGQTNAAPEELYLSMDFHKAPIELEAEDLLRTERYTVRLHFSTFHFAFPGDVVQNISINGQTVAENFDPAQRGGGANKAVVLEFDRIVPTKENAIAIRLAPALAFGRAALSGLEIILQRDK